jgi:hypothetical protein
MARTAWFQRFHIDRRLLWLAGMAALLILGELGLRAWEAQQQLQTELKKVRGRAAVLAAGSDQIDWSARTKAAEAQRNELQARLWQSPSEAQAQARLRDWLTAALRSAAVPRPVVNLLPPQAGSASSAAGSEPPPIRVRASLNFDLAPNALENALVQIEAGGQLASIDSLTVAARNRRVEMTVSVPVLLQSQGAR